MPTYEYRCEKCQHTLEAWQKISDAALIHCPSCGEESLQRLISGGNFQLKGSGWYVTDYKKSAGESRDGSASSSGNKATPPPEKTSGASG